MVWDMLGWRGIASVRYMVLDSDTQICTLYFVYIYIYILFFLYVYIISIYTIYTIYY